MTETPISFNDFYRIVEDNKDNITLTVNLKEYRKTYPPVSLNKKKFLDELFLSFNNKENVFYNAVKNIINREEFRIISLEEFFDKIFILFKDIVIKINSIINLDNSANIHFYFDELGKSNFWLCLLFSKYIKDENLYDQINDKIYFIDSNDILENWNNKNNYVIFLDDCSYSGRQLTSNIKNFTGKNYVKGNYLFLPYISSVALKKLQNEISTLEINYKEQITSIKHNKELLKVILENNLLILDENDTVINNFMEYLSLISELTLPVLLEIKNADALSVCQFLFNYIYTPSMFPKKLKIYKIKQTIIESLVNTISDDTINNNNNYFSKISKLKLSLFDENYDNEKKLFETYFEIFQLEVSFDQNKNYTQKTIGLLNNCYQQKYIDIIRNNTEMKFATDYPNDILCFSAFYRKNVFNISTTVAEILKKNVTNEVNKIIANGEKIYGGVSVGENLNFLSDTTYFTKYMKYKIKYLKLKK